MIYLSDKPRRAQKEYLKLVQIEDSPNISGFFTKKNGAGVLGSIDFVEWVKAKYDELKKDQEAPAARQLVPTMLQI